VSSVPEDDRVGVSPTIPEDDEVGGVEHLNCPHASRFCVVEQWPRRPLPPLSWIPSMQPRLPWRLLGYVTALRPLRLRPPLVWEGSMRPLRPLSLLAAGETAMRGISMWTRRSEPTRGMVGSKSVLGVGELKVIDDLGGTSLFLLLSPAHLTFSHPSLQYL
jgi:hypothetical protein